MFGTFFSKNLFFKKKNDLPDLDSLVQIKNRDIKLSPNCSEAHTGASTVSGDSAGD